MISAAAFSLGSNFFLFCSPDQCQFDCLELAEKQSQTRVSPSFRLCSTRPPGKQLLPGRWRATASTMPRCEASKEARTAAHPLRIVHSSCLCARTATHVGIPQLTAPHASCPQVHSHLYATDGRMVGTFQRIDIPILHEWVTQLLCIANNNNQPERSVCLWPTLQPLFYVNIGQHYAALPAGLISTTTCSLQVSLVGCSRLSWKAAVCLAGSWLLPTKICCHVA